MEALNNCAFEFCYGILSSKSDQGPKMFLLVGEEKPFMVA